MVSLEASAWGQPLTVSRYGTVQYGVHAPSLVGFSICRRHPLSVPLRIAIPYIRKSVL